MKKVAGFIALFAMFITMSASANPISLTDGPGKADPSAMNEAKWEAFSESLVNALASDHIGLQQAALRMIIQYGDQIDVDAALFDVMHVYRDGQDDSMRRMAVVALGKMHSSMAIDFLARSVRFEKSPCVKKTMLAVIAEHQQVS